MTNTTEALARLFTEAARIREESFDHSAAEAAEEANKVATDEYEKRSPNSSYYPTPDYSKFYTKDLHQAAEQACKEAEADPRLAQMVQLALYTCWNDILGWANDCQGSSSGAAKEEVSS